MCDDRSLSRTTDLGTARRGTLKEHTLFTAREDTCLVLRRLADLTISFNLRNRFSSSKIRHGEAVAGAAAFLGVVVSTTCSTSSLTPSACSMEMSIDNKMLAPRRINTLGLSCAIFSTDTKVTRVLRRRLVAEEDGRADQCEERPCSGRGALLSARWAPRFGRLSKLQATGAIPSATLAASSRSTCSCARSFRSRCRRAGPWRRRGQGRHRSQRKIRGSDMRAASTAGERRRGRGQSSPQSGVRRVYIILLSSRTRVATTRGA